MQDINPKIVITLETLFTIFRSSILREHQHDMSNPFCNPLQRLTTNVDKSSHLFYSAFQTKQSLLKFSLR